MASQPLKVPSSLPWARPCPPTPVLVLARVAESGYGPAWLAYPDSLGLLLICARKREGDKLAVSTDQLPWEENTGFPVISAISPENCGKSDECDQLERRTAEKGRQAAA